jgi:hypothetical protein
MQGIKSTIDAILINNPSAVSSQLAAYGLVEEQVLLSPDEIKGVLYDAVHRLSDDDSNELAVRILDVPIDLEGDYAEQLVDFHIRNGNRIAVMAELLENETSEPSDRHIRIGGRPYRFSRKLEYLAGLFLIVLIIAILKKTFFSK